MPMPEHLRRGLRGEQLTARFLRAHGYDVVSANYRTGLGETDIVALSPEGELCFVEVKTRAPGGMFPPSDAVDRDKQERLISNALVFAKRFDEPFGRIRFDIAEVILHSLDEAEITLLENAFGREYHAQWRKPKDEKQ
jgi:putative endonuclease